MQRVRRGPSIVEFVRYYVLVLLSERQHTRRELVQLIKEKSADNRNYRRYGAVWVAADEMDGVLGGLMTAGLIEGGRKGKWKLTAAGRKRRAQYEQQHDDQPTAKEQAATKLMDLMVSPRTSSRVLDVGTGKGFLAMKIAARGMWVLGVDSACFEYSEDSIDQAREEARQYDGNVEFRQVAVRDLAHLNGSFDYVVSSQAIHCMDDQQGCLRAVCDLLVPGGQFLCMDFAVGLRGFLVHGFHSFLAISREEWEQYLPDCGFEQIEIHHVDDYLVVSARKPT